MQCQKKLFWYCCVLVEANGDQARPMTCAASSHNVAVAIHALVSALKALTAYKESGDRTLFPCGRKLHSKIYSRNNHWQVRQLILLIMAEYCFLVVGH